MFNEDCSLFYEGVFFWAVRDFFFLSGMLLEFLYFSLFMMIEVTQLPRFIGSKGVRKVLRWIYNSTDSVII